MPLDAQPPGRRGTVGHPYSALNLRLLLAVFGAVVCVVVGVLLIRAGWPAPGSALLALAVVATVDAAVVQLRRRARRRSEGGGRSLFE
jgi:hypothetical protein